MDDKTTRVTKTVYSKLVPLRHGQLRAAIEAALLAGGGKEAASVSLREKGEDGAQSSRDGLSTADLETLTSLSGRTVFAWSSVKMHGAQSNASVQVGENFSGTQETSVSCDSGKTLQRMLDAALKELEVSQHWTSSFEAWNALNEGGLPALLERARNEAEAEQTPERPPERRRPPEESPRAGQLPEKVTVWWLIGNLSLGSAVKIAGMLIALILTVAWAAFSVGRSRWARDYLDEEGKPTPMTNSTAEQTVQAATPASNTSSTRPTQDLPAQP